LGFAALLFSFAVYKTKLNMKLLYTLGLLLLAHYTRAQVQVVKLNKSTLPKQITYTGRLVNAVQFTDNGGKHIVITSETGITDAKGSDFDGYRNAALYAQHYVCQGNTQKLLWQVHDFVKECPLDIEASFIPGSFSVTDADRNGTAEVWLMYKTVCRGDVSPADLKVIMYEGTKKYAMRGHDKVKVSATATDGGDYRFDEAFNRGPAAFKTYALKLWKRFVR
jgi:hypothetical protein